MFKLPKIPEDNKTKYYTKFSNKLLLLHFEKISSFYLQKFIYFIQNDIIEWSRDHRCHHKWTGENIHFI